MKIALIMPKGNAYSFKNRSILFKYMPDSLTLGTLYGIIKKSFPDIEIEIYDETVEKIDKTAINADLIGISAMTPVINKAYEYAQHFKQRDIPVFIGGIHSTLCPDEVSVHCDSVISGLAEESLIELINDFKSGSLKKIYYQNPNMSFENMALPQRDLYEKKHFMGTEINMVQASFGCTNVCDFCVQPYVCCGYHKRPVDDVIEEIKTIKDDCIEFLDPNFAKDTEYLKEICEKLIPLNKKWFAPVEISIYKNSDLLKLMKKSGCYEVLIGFESINESSIQTVHKGFNRIEDYKKAIAKLHKYGIKVTGSFVLGLDGDDEDSFKHILDFVNDAHIDYVRYTINTPYPGTSFYEKMKEEGRILINDWSKYDCQTCVIKPAKMTPAVLESWHRILWKKTYSIGSILKRLSYIDSFSERLKYSILNYCFGKIYEKMVLKRHK